MRSWLLALLLFVVPLQFVWASAAPYCAHETGATTSKHFGHHEHRHQANGDATAATDDRGDDLGAYHADCEACHMGCAAKLVAPSLSVDLLQRGAVVGFDEPRFVSHVPAGPERPDRSELTLAVRCGDGVVLGLQSA